MQISALTYRTLKITTQLSFWLVHSLLSLMLWVESLCCIGFTCSVILRITSQGIKPPDGPLRLPGEPGRQPDCANRQAVKLRRTAKGCVSGLRLGSDGNCKFNPCSGRAPARSLATKNTWPLRTPALRSDVFLLISGSVDMLRWVPRSGRIKSPSFVRDKGEVHAAGALVTAACRCFSALRREELTET